MSSSLIIPPFIHSTPTTIIPRNTGSNLDLGTGDITTTGIISGDGSGLTNLPSGVAIGDTVTGAADQQILYTNGTTLAQNATFEFDDSGQTLRVGYSGTINNANSVTTGVLQATSVIATPQLGSTTIQYELANERGVIEMFKSSGVGNTYPDHQILLTEASGVTSQIPFSVGQTASLIILNEADGSNVMDVQIQNGGGTSIAHFDTANLNVGIGTTTPDASAKLDVDSTTQGFAPPRMTNAQILAIASPVDGLMAYSTDDTIMYQYDDSRSKWLSMHEFQMEFSENGGADGVNLRYGGDMFDDDSGFLSPLDGTITRVTCISDGGNATKGFEIRINDATGPAAYSFNLVANRHIDNVVNVSFAADDVITTFAVAAGGGATDPAMTIWYKWELN